MIFVPGTPEDRDLWRTLDARIADAKKHIAATKQAARPEFDKWLAGPAKQALSAKVPADGLRLQAPLSEGKGRQVAVTLDAKPRTLALAADAAWTPGEIAAEGVYRRAQDPRGDCRRRRPRRPAGVFLRSLDQAARQGRHAVR